MDRDTARRIIGHLKAGSTPIDCVEHVNVGNERWYSAAAEQLDEIQADGDSLVRFVKGYVGDGKTHFMGMLRSIALGKTWLVTYVTAENTPLNRFNAVYEQLIRNLTLPPSIVIPAWLEPSDVRGSHALMAALFARFYHEAYRLLDKSGLHKERVLEAIRHKAAQLVADPKVNERLGKAILAYVEAMLRSDHTVAHDVCIWLEGGDGGNSSIGRRIDQKTARDMSRGVSVLARRAGVSGILVLLDEAERIMEQSRSIRNKSYGVLRDLLDNADNQGGMYSSIVYVAATPDVFEAEKGFAEYDALRSRLANSTRFSLPGLVDWRGVTVDLTKTPLPHDHLVQLAGRIMDIHAAARDWHPRDVFCVEAMGKMVSSVESGAFSVSKPRLLASSMATCLEMLEQNREVAALDLLDATLRTVEAALVHKPETAPWA